MLATPKEYGLSPEAWALAQYQRLGFPTESPLSPALSTHPDVVLVRGHSAKFQDHDISRHLVAIAEWFVRTCDS